MVHSQQVGSLSGGVEEDHTQSRGNCLYSVLLGNVDPVLQNFSDFF